MKHRGKYSKHIIRLKMENSYTGVVVLFSTDQYNNSCKQFAQYKLWIKQSMQ